jgi:hypothetical protein
VLPTMSAIASRDFDRDCSTTSTRTPDLTHPRRRTPLESDSLRGSRGPNSCNGEPPRRNSAFLEVGLGGEDAIIDSKLRRDSRPKSQVYFQREVDVDKPEAVDSSATSPADNLPRPQMSSYFPTLPRLLLLALAIVLVAPSLRGSPLLTATANPLGRNSGSSGTFEPSEEVKRKTLLRKSKRQDTQTDVCKRWAGQSAIVNGTLYYYGGRATTSADQTTNEWSMLP